MFVCIRSMMRIKMVGQEEGDTGTTPTATHTIAQSRYNGRRQLPWCAGERSLRSQSRIFNGNGITNFRPEGQRESGNIL